MQHDYEHICNLNIIKKTYQHKITDCFNTDTAFINKLEKGKRQTRPEQIFLF